MPCTLQGQFRCSYLHILWGVMSWGSNFTLISMMHKFLYSLPCKLDVMSRQLCRPVCYIPWFLQKGSKHQSIYFEVTFCSDNVCEDTNWSTRWVIVCLVDTGWTNIFCMGLLSVKKVCKVLMHAMHMPVLPKPYMMTGPTLTTKMETLLLPITCF